MSAGGVGFAELLAVDEIRNLIVFAVTACHSPARPCGGTGPSLSTVTPAAKPAVADHICAGIGPRLRRDWQGFEQLHDGTWVFRSDDA